MCFERLHWIGKLLPQHTAAARIASKLQTCARKKRELRKLYAAMTRGEERGGGGGEECERRETHARTALYVESSVAAGRVNAHLAHVGVAAVEMVLNDCKLKGKAIHAAAARRFVERK